MALMFARQQEAYASFRPRPTDVIISPFAKCGTTWLQQILHGLRTSGDMRFSDIYEVVPFIDVAPNLGQDLTADQRAAPRVFKSHGTWHEMPRGCRYVVSFRDPKDAAVSFHRFMEGWLVQRGSIGVDEVVAHPMFLPDSEYSYWTHASSWLAQRGNPDVLLVTFEDMKDNLQGVVEHIATFLSLDDRRAVDIATSQASFEFMSTHAAAFSEPLMKAWVEQHIGIPTRSDASKVRRGRVGAGRSDLGATTADRLDQLWRTTIGAQFGYAAYEDLVADLKVPSR